MINLEKRGVNEGGGGGKQKYILQPARFKFLNSDFLVPKFCS